MGREVRRVPPNWQHPKKEDSDYVPLHGGSFSERILRWEEENEKWNEGLRDDWNGGWKPIEEEDKHMTFAEWGGDRPEESDYMPDWPESERTHYQMYESTTNGTPISPVFATKEDLARWLADNNASAFADMTATYEQWLSMIVQQSAPSMVFKNGRLISGVEAVENSRRNNDHD